MRCFQVVWGVCVALGLLATPAMAQVTAPAAAPGSSAPATQTSGGVKAVKIRKMPEKEPAPADLSLRLRMRLSVSRTTDIVSVSPGDTEDEVYYGVAMQRGKEGALPKMEVFKRSGDPDIWEMGKRSLKYFDRVLFEGKVPVDENIVFVIAIAEQDNKQMSQIPLIFDFGLGLATQVFDNDTSNAKNMNGMKGQLKALADRISAEKDEVIGLVVVAMKNGRLNVEAAPQTFSKIKESSPAHPVIELTGANSLYSLQLFSENPDEVKAPKDRYLLAVEEDNCSGDLWIDTKNGKLQIKKGNRADFRPPFYKFKWWCDGTEESTTASSKTTLIDATRASDGREILWRTFSEPSLPVDFKP